MNSTKVNKTIYDILLMIAHATQVLKDKEAAALVITSACEIIERRFDISEEETSAILKEWEMQRVYPEPDPNLGNCGFPCDGHCQECDPFYGMPGYDGNDEI